MRILTRRRSSTTVLAAAMAGIFLCGVPTSAAQGSSVTRGCDAAWTQVSTPKISAAESTDGANSQTLPFVSSLLTGVDTVAKGNAVAVGTHRDFNSPQFMQGQGVGATSVDRFTDTGAQQVPSPSIPPETDSQLSLVSFDTPNDGWAGGLRLTRGQYAPLVEHWDGVHWAVSPILTRPRPGGVVTGLKAFGPKDAWVSVQPPASSDPRPQQTYGVIEHWDGTSWSYVPYPGETDPAANPYLMTLAGTGPHDLWVLGGRGDMDGPVAYHWTGSSWSTVTMPLPENAGNYRLYGANAKAADDAWAVGYYVDTNSGSNRPLTEHWDGRSWHAITAQTPTGTNRAILNGVTVISPTDVWAVGAYTSGPGPVGANLAEHWDGSTWTLSKLPGFQPDNSGELTAVSAASPTDIWAVGFVFQPVPDQGGRPNTQPEVFHYRCRARH